MEPTIQFQENQTKIYLGKHKLIKSAYENSEDAEQGFIDLHLVCQADETSGYGNEKFVSILIFENKYSIEEIKQEIENGFQNILYFENGDYLYAKKEF